MFFVSVLKDALSGIQVIVTNGISIISWEADGSDVFQGSLHSEGMVGRTEEKP
jgi:hypothetical protein